MEESGVELVDERAIVQVGPVGIHDEHGVEQSDLGIGELERTGAHGQLEHVDHEEAERHETHRLGVHEPLEVGREHESIARIDEHERVGADELERAALQQLHAIVIVQLTETRYVLAILDHVADERYDRLHELIVAQRLSSSSATATTSDRVVGRSGGAPRRPLHVALTDARERAGAHAHVSVDETRAEVLELIGALDARVPVGYVYELGHHFQVWRCVRLWLWLWLSTESRWLGGRDAGHLLSFLLDWRGCRT